MGIGIWVLFIVVGALSAGIEVACWPSAEVAMLAPEG